MFSRKNPQQSLPFSPPSGTITAKISQEDTQTMCGLLERVVRPNDSFEQIQKNLHAVWWPIYNALQTIGDLNIKGRLRNWDEFEAYVKPGSNVGRKLVNLLRSMATNQVPWGELFENEAFLKPVKSPDPPMVHATTLAWSREYKGNLTNVLYDTIADYLDLDRTPYARLTSIVNSSGTGKSRVVDELGREIITVPMCLRPGNEGFPPPDRELRDWLISGGSDRDAVQKRLHAFIYSLLAVTQSELETIASQKTVIPKLPHFKKKSSEEAQKQYLLSVINRHKRLASAFRDYMTTGQSYSLSNSDREKFYNKVIKGANEFVGKPESKLVRDENELVHGRYTFKSAQSEDEDPQVAGKRLCRFIDRHKVLRSNTGPRRPLLILAFDEAHVLTDYPQHQSDWNLFSELRRVLRQINDLPMFSVFLSTAGRFEKFSPETRFDPSARARDADNRPLSPITEISFDDIAYPAIKDTISIDTVVHLDWISHLGRPLFGSYWDNIPWQIRKESAIIDYAKQKLLNGPNELRGNNPAGTLACLSVRFALEFNMDVSARDVSRTQVERHMRLCVAANVGLEKLITVPGSEPLLAEAAYQLMKGTKKNPVRHLAEHLDLNCVDRGRRGELVAALLVMQVYDVARAMSRKRWVSVANFMEALLPTSDYKALLRSGPTSWPMDRDDAKTFKEIFKDYSLWFNHVIKIENKKMISIDHLWKFVTRGAMVLCATGQEGIDIVLPAHYTPQNLGPDSVTAVVIQVKNAHRYKETFSPILFDAMNSAIKLDIFSKLGVDSVPSDSEEISEPAEPPKKKRKVALKPTTVDPKPVIRLVFALASPEPAVILRTLPKKGRRFDGFMTFDMWLAGLSCETFKQIQGDLESYETLLERSLMSHDGFKLKDEPTIGKEARKVRGPRRRRMAPLTLPERSHHSIHIPDSKELVEGFRVDPASLVD